jgi:hypothetical protein
MILTKNVVVKINKKNIDHYKKHGFLVKLGDSIEINPDLLIRGSNMKIDVSCDRCGLERNIKFQSYIFNINRSTDGNTYTCDKCSHEKIKQTNLKKYGVEYFSQTGDFNEKIKKTSLKKFGAEHFSKTEEYINRRNSTNLEKFGVENPFELTDLVKSGMIKKHGVDHPSKIESKKKDKENKRRKTKEGKGDWIKLEQLKPWIIYRNKVRTLTLKNKKELFEKWDGYDYYDKEYIIENMNLHFLDSKFPTIDHKISIQYGFINAIKEEEISGIENLCITKRILNISKGSKNHYD